MNFLFFTGMSSVHWFDCGELISVWEIEEIVVTDVSIVPTLRDNIRMRDYYEKNSIWAKALSIMRSKSFDRDLQISDFASSQANTHSNMSRFLHKLEHCISKNAEV
jgi:hypothetical protein